MWLPTYAPWLNPIEKLWRWLRQDQLYVHRLAQDWSVLRQRVNAFFDQFAAGSHALLRYVGLLGEGKLAVLYSRLITSCASSKSISAWGAALSSVQSGVPAFERHFSASYFQYLAAHPEFAATFNAAMTGWSAQVASAVVAAYDFARCGTVVDVGGGHGTLLAAIVASQPHVRGILFDLPHVTAGATPLLTAAGVADRCEAVGGDFFTAVPSGDTYVLAQILHDWDDDRSRTILEHCRFAPWHRMAASWSLSWCCHPATSHPWASGSICTCWCC